VQHNDNLLTRPHILQHKWQSACQVPCRQWTTQNAYLCCLWLKWISTPLQGCFLSNTSVYIWCMCIYVCVCVCVYIYIYIYIYIWIPLLFYDRGWIISIANIQVPISQTTFLARNIWKIPLCKAIKVLSLVANEYARLCTRTSKSNALFQTVMDVADDVQNNSTYLSYSNAVSKCAFKLQADHFSSLCNVFHY